MLPFKKILNKLNGLHYPQEYLCFANESFQQSLKTYIVSGKRVTKDITSLHTFAGYHPVIFALHFQLPGNPSAIRVVFSDKLLQPNGIFRDKDAIASLIMKKIDEQIAGNDSFAYYEAIRGSHRMVSGFSRFIINLDNRLFNKKPGNVFLPGNLYTQVQIAYALPRVISLITVGQNGLFNLFPTDLNGPAGDHHYIVSLRHAGKAYQQVEAARRIVLSQVHSDSYKNVYALGKNHMQDLKPRDQLPFSAISSAHFQWPVPGFATTYRELELEGSFRRGIHQVMLFRVISKNTLPGAVNTLAHIHNLYATWRDNNKLEGNYLLR